MQTFRGQSAWGAGIGALEGRERRQRAVLSPSPHRSAASCCARISAPSGCRDRRPHVGGGRFAGPGPPSHTGARGVKHRRLAVPGDDTEPETSSGGTSGEKSMDDEDDEKELPTVTVRFSVKYGCHVRQMICVAGSQYPLGWSFLSVASVPMEWNEGDIWTAEVKFPAGANEVQYKYVILEDQDWSSQSQWSDAEGNVKLEKDSNYVIRHMAIVAWQPGNNRYINIPSVEKVEAEGEQEVVLDVQDTWV